MAVIPFYGAKDRELFAIERAAMDRPGKVIAALDAMLPDGLVLDIGAGDGFTGQALTTESRSVVALEPAPGMVDGAAPLHWVHGDATALPFGDDAFGGVYATWAYFFTRGWDPTPGIREAERVVAPGGTLAFVDNLGDDEFSAMADGDIYADVARWESWGFETTVIDTAFVFETMHDAERLLTLFFGDRAEPRLEVGYRVGLFTKTR